MKVWNSLYQVHHRANAFNSMFIIFHSAHLAGGERKFSGSWVYRCISDRYNTDIFVCY